MKKRIKVTFESPVLCLVVILAFIVLMLDKYVPSLKLMSFFQVSAKPFDFKNPLCYLRTVSHVLGSSSPVVFLFGALGLLIQGPEAEKNYGTVLSSVMIVVSAVFTGVLATCFCKNPVSGLEPVLFLFVFLNLVSYIKKNNLPFVQILVLLILIIWDIFSAEKIDVINLLADIMGGLCGSLISFLAVPKSRSTSHKKISPSEDETVVGTLNI